jgi:hypothetical protein
MTADSLVLQLKYDGVIEKFALHTAKSLREAMDLFYKSITYDEMCNGISDMHCRSDEYLAEELRLELEQSA